MGTQEEKIVSLNWKFEKNIQVVEPVTETEILMDKFILAIEMLRELGQLPEFNRLKEKYIKEKPSVDA